MCMLGKQKCNSRISATAGKRLAEIFSLSFVEPGVELNNPMGLFQFRISYDSTVATKILLQEIAPKIKTINKGFYENKKISFLRWLLTFSGENRAISILVLLKFCRIPL